ncbi:MAG: UDP-N-acetylglucosamine 4,6-dehydratase, partial [Candidatus Marinimicrobia bacterium]|nr:UDP-N-acetylglucosamine 4,6-dehydratase [Candidatus Neomarinimicrobiota bacterium]
MHNNREKLKLIGRKNKLFNDDISQYENKIVNIVSESKFLVLGGAGSIGQAVTKEIFKRKPQKLHVVDISENNLVELVRDIRSSLGYIDGDFKTFALDIGSIEYDAFFNSDGKYDYVLNLSALKHVRSEEDAFTLMRMINVNIFNTEKTLKQCIEKGVKKYFCVSTDKAANPVNMMGASKRIMEMFISRRSKSIDVSMARFANVAFSDGSLLYGFNQRIEKKQPIVAPDDVRRYFIIDEESGELCMMSSLFGQNRDIFFPKPNKNLSLIKFSEIAKKYLRNKNLKPLTCKNEDEARNILSRMSSDTHWPCLFTKSTTTGEKDFEEFFTDKEILDMSRFSSIGIIKNENTINENILDTFESNINKIK